MGRELIAKLKRERLFRDGHVGRPPVLEELEAEQREIEREDEYVVALERERRGVQFNLDYLRGMRPDARVPLVGDVVGEETPSYRERAAAVEARLEAIDAELARIGG